VEREIVISEETVMRPVLIVDKEGVMGQTIVGRIHDEFLPVLISSRDDNKAHVKSVFIPWKKRIPKIPHNLFHSIIIVDNNYPEEKMFISAVIKEAKNRNIPLAVILQKNYSNQEKEKKFINFYDNASLFVIGDVIEKLTIENNVTRLLFQAKGQRQVYLENSGLELCYPVSLGFVVDVIVREFYLAQQKKRVLYVFPKHGYTMFAMARMLQEIDSNIKVDFAKNRKTKESNNVEEHGENYLAEPIIGLKKAMIDVYRKEVNSNQLRSYKEHKKKGMHKFFGKVLLSLFSTFFFITGVILITFIIGGIFLRSAAEEVFAGRVESALSHVAIAKKAFSNSKLVAKGVQLVFERIGGENLMTASLYRIELAEEATNGLENVVKAEIIYKKIFLNKTNISKKEFVEANNLFRVGLLGLEKLSQEKQLPFLYQKKIAELSGLGKKFIAVSDVLPDVLGFEGKRKYLLLFQNNNELRPGGGFIGSYAIIEFDHGKIGDILVNDVYDADGQLKGHVEPPYALKKYLGLAHWYLRDSNFSVDYLDNAAKAAFFLELETGEKVDGVFALDTTVLSRLLEVTGPVQVTEYKLEVDSRNFATTTQEVIESSFFPGSTEKKNILSSVLRATFAKINKGVDQVKLSQEIANLFKEKHILIALANPDSQQPFSLEGLSSTLLDVREKTSDQVNDFLGINEANVGVNKVNAFIKRSFQYDVTLTGYGKIEGRVTVSLVNTSTQGQKFGGDYKTYIRFILPKGASPTSLAIDGIEQVVLAPLESEQAYKQRGEVAKNSVEVIREDYSSNSVYGFFTMVPAEEAKKIVVTYVFPEDKTSGKAFFTYSLLLFKQPGTGNDPYQFSFSYPKEYRASSLTKSMASKEGRIYQGGFLDQDKVIEVSVGKKY
jgi:hypothetical protein